MQSIALIAVLALCQTSGLKITDLAAGKGAVAKKGDVVAVEYTGKLDSGRVFDTSSGKGPYAFQLGGGKVIAGWEKGILGMKVGGKRKLVIPPELGYGSRSMGPIPANSRLTFEVKLLRIDPNGTKQKIDFTDLKVGKGKPVKAGDRISVHYRGTFLNGHKFDSSYDRSAPLKLKVGAGDVIKGMDQGVLGMKAGGKRRLVVPFDLAYGKAGRPPVIPAMSTLVFELDLIRIEP